MGKKLLWGPHVDRRDDVSAILMVAESRDDGVIGVREMVVGHTLDAFMECRDPKMGVVE